MAMGQAPSQFLTNILLAAVVDDSTRAKINVGPIPKHGSEYTPNQSRYRASDFRQQGGPSFRVVVDVATGTTRVR